MEPVEGRAPSLDALGELLLATKFAVPEPRAPAVSRLDLIERARTDAYQVVGVTAPAGYGKSTLLAEWARFEDRRVAWVSLDRFDDDPTALLLLLASAYCRLDPGRAYLVTEMRGAGVSVLGRAAPRLASAFASSPVSFTLFLDDLQELRSTACLDVLDLVASRIPVGSQLVAASRAEQAHLPRLRAAGRALGLEMSDLALDAAGAQRLLTELHVDLPAETVAHLAERTEGWPVGLHLAALIARESGEPTIELTGDDRYVADYLYRETLMRQPDDVQAFLRRTATLEEMCGPLCDATLGTSDAAMQLRRLEGSDLFLVPIDRRRAWYRYHGLFREFLLGELRRIEPECISKLHLRAADWYEAAGSGERALEHLLNTPERRRAAELVTTLALSTYNSGRMSTLERWLSTLGEDAIREYPPLAVLAGHVSILTGDPSGAERWAAFVETLAFDLPTLDGSASFESARAMLRGVMCASGPEAMLEDATFAVEQEGVGSPWRDTALWEAGEALQLLGRVDEARARYLESSSCAAAMNSADSLIISEAELAMLAMDRDDWDDAARHVTVAAEVIEDHQLQDYVLSLLAHVAAARLALHHGDRDEATTHVARAMRARATATFVTPVVAVRLRVHLARVHLALGETRTARHLLREIDDILIHRLALGCLLDEVDDVRARAADAAADTSSVSPLTPAELRLLPYLQTHLNFQQIGQRLFVSRHTVASQVHAIYRKFGVSSRHDAIEHAMQIGLLGD